MVNTTRTNTNTSIKMGSQLRNSLSDFITYLDEGDRVSKSTLSLYVDIIIRWIKYVHGRYNMHGNGGYNMQGNGGSGSHNLNGQLNVQTAQEYINYLTKAGKSSNTVSTSGYAIKKFLSWKGIDPKTMKLDIPPIKFREPRYRTLDEVNKVIDSCISPLETTLITLMFDTGARVSEILNLTLDDIDWDAGMITVTRKGGRKDNINISDKSSDALKEWLKIRKFNSKRIFGDLDYYSTWKMVKKIGKRANIELNPHIFRHSRAIHLLKNRVPVGVVSQHLGHRNIMTTMNIYGRFTAADIKDQLAGW